MDSFTVMINRLNEFIERIKIIYSYIFSVFLPAMPDGSENNANDGKSSNIRL